MPRKPHGRVGPEEEPQHPLRTRARESSGPVVTGVGTVRRPGYPPPEPGMAPPHR